MFDTSKLEQTSSNVAPLEQNESVWPLPLSWKLHPWALIGWSPLMVCGADQFTPVL